ncbi:CBS domain-containing protein [Niabella insulamsoli]|uniref:CBS domain-containing protein n=1 Tax=Niabella insulamsoli TaxID=3144874 RepID=UPI0031FC17B3
MLVSNLPLENLPQVRLSDKIYYVLQLMSEYLVHELPVVDGEVFRGIVKEEKLLSVDENMKVAQLEPDFLNVCVHAGDHLLKAVSLAVTLNLSVLPVVDEESKIVGTIETRHLLQDMADFMDLSEPGALIVLEVDTVQYSFSEISRIVESNDAQITQLNTSKNIESGLMRVTLKINKLEVSDIVATFQRYEYHVKYYFGEELYSNELKSNYENLMSYLNV